MRNTVDITGLDKVDLLCGFWQGTKTVGMGFMAGRDGMPPTKEEARRHLARGGGAVDYFLGKPIKFDLSPNCNSLDPWDYDCIAGAGTCQKVVDRIRMLAGHPDLTVTAVAAPPPPSPAARPAVVAPPPSPTSTEQIGAFTVRTFGTSSDAMNFLIHRQEDDKL